MVARTASRSFNVCISTATVECFCVAVAVAVAVGKVVIGFGLMAGDGHGWAVKLYELNLSFQTHFHSPKTSLDSS